MCKSGMIETNNARIMLRIVARLTLALVVPPYVIP